MEKALYVLFPFLKLPFVLKDVKRFVTSKNSCTFALSKDKITLFNIKTSQLWQIRRLTTMVLNT